MTRLPVFVLVLAALAAGCSKASPASPSSNDGSTSTTVFSVPLSSAGETPAIANAEAAAAGTATITLKATKNAAGSVTAATADFQVTANGLTPASQITMAHIHRGAAGANGSIVVNTGLASGQAPVSGAGSSTFQTTSVTVPADIAEAILSAPAGFYFNVHTAMNADGVIRGQLNGTTGAPAQPGDPGPGYDY